MIGLLNFKKKSSKNVNQDIGERENFSKLLNYYRDDDFDFEEEKG